MNRREHLRLLLAGSVGAGVALSAGCNPEHRARSERIIAHSGGYGRNPDEAARDRRLDADAFFSEAEYALVRTLADIIIPAGGGAGSASEAGVVDFIEFMMKDDPDFQVPMRGGLMWLDSRCVKRFGRSFVECEDAQQLALVEEIAWPDAAAAELAYGVSFFNQLRDLVAIGYFTSEMGVKYLGYAGNVPNFWDGVPAAVLERHGLGYDARTLERCIKGADRARIVEWDAAGNPV